MADGTDAERKPVAPGGHRTASPAGAAATGTAEPGRLAARAGEYEMQFNRDRFPLTLRLENGALIMQVPFMSLPEELVPVEENVLIGLSRGWRFELNGDSLSVIIDPGTRIRGRKKQ